MSVNGSVVLVENSAGTGLQRLKVDATGRLECSVNEIEITASTINLNTDGLEGLQTTMVSSLGDIKTSVEIIDNCVAGTELQVDIVSGTITMPVGSATSANQATVIGHLDGVEASLTAITGYVDGVEALIGTTNSSIATMDAVMDNILLKNTEIDAVLDTINGKITACNTGAVVLSGASVVSLSAVDNAVLDAIDTVLDTINGKVVACNTGAVVLSGASVVSLSATDNAVLDTIDAVLDTIKTDTDAVKTAVESIDDAYGAMTVSTIMNAVTIGNMSNADTSVITKPSWVKDIGFMLKGSLSGSYEARMCFSNDNVNFSVGDTFNYSGNQTIAYSVSRNGGTGIGWKYYKIQITNTDASSQDFTITSAY